MSRIATPFTDLLQLDTPIVQAPMSSAASVALATAVSNAGGLGMISGTWLEPDALRAMIREVRAGTARPFGVNLGLAWPQEERLEICVNEGVRAISLFWGDPSHYVDRAKSGGAVVMQTVGSPELAREAVAAGVDVLVAQGWEAGGHLDSRIGNLALVPAVVDEAGSSLVIAAGGISDGRGMAAALALGAAGVWIGTRFLLTEEAHVHQHYQSRLLAASADDTVFSTVFDVGWADAPHRTLHNESVRLWDAAGRPPMGSRPGEGELLGEYPDGRPITRYDVGFPRPGASGDVDAMALYAGQGVGLVRDVLPAADVIARIESEARRAGTSLADSFGNADTGVSEDS